MEKYPLQWPTGYTRSKTRERSSFKQTMDKAQRFLHDEVARMGAKHLVVSSNIPIRQDGMMYSAYTDRNIADPGVAIYFTMHDKSISMCCDKYRSVWENVYALAKGIEALRGMDRWGVSDFIDRAFTGFTALPPVKRPWWIVLGYSAKPGKEVWDWSGIQSQYRSLAKKLHPDSGGSTSGFQELLDAFHEAKKEFNVPV